MTCSQAECERPSYCRSLCVMHYKRLWRHGDPTTTLINPRHHLQHELTRLSAQETEECILWPYGLSSNGYGNISINNKNNGVHVLVCVSTYGPRPKGKHAAHTCGVRHCINPRHLRWATPSENHLDKWAHGTMPHGDTHWRRQRK